MASTLLIASRDAQKLLDVTRLLSTSCLLRELSPVQNHGPVWCPACATPRSKYLLLLILGAVVRQVFKQRAVDARAARQEKTQKNRIRRKREVGLVARRVQLMHSYAPMR